ncbi:MAG: tRNA-dihydrouridine synthase A [Alphaproteobacteria bacterium]|jgi:tRNA-dihydrouridine synthase A
MTKKFSIAPMMSWTDRHCRYFHRLLSSQAILYTEMVTAEAIVHGDLKSLLGFSPQEHPIILQLGGSDPKKLSKAAIIATDFGYDGINLNVGCPSDRVQSGAFGACLMHNPSLVGESVAAMQSVTNLPITVKCRLGIDDDEPSQTLPNFIETVHQAGCQTFIIHARKAWLKGLSPKENRDIPPLDYALVYDIKKQYPHLHIGINGGINDPADWQTHLKYVDEVMVGRAAYHTPEILTQVDEKIYGHQVLAPDYRNIIEKMMLYCDQQKSKNVKLYHIIRHMLGLFHGQPNARLWRRILTEEGTKEDAKSTLLLDAYNAFKAK